MSEIKKIKPALSKGTRDFLPGEVAKRNYIFDTIKSVFRKYGFEEIETPAIERMETLTGKYGEEGDKLLFKIINSGDPFKDLSQEEKNELQRAFRDELPILLQEQYNSQGIIPTEEMRKRDREKTIAIVVKKLTEKGLRYDLTVPLARYVVMHQEHLAFPFRRFHIGPVWRADRPQKGRYQEFYQCDADVIGSESLVNEIELTLIYAEVFSRLGIKTILYYNHRKVFDAFTEILNITDRLPEFIEIFDQLDKIGWEGVSGLLQSKLGLHQNQLTIISNELHGKIHYSSWFKSAKSGQIAAQSLFEYENRLNSLGNSVDTNIKLNNHLIVQYNPTLARGLSYYTGIIWEVVIDWQSGENENIKIGSLGGGGRYANLTEMFGAKNMSGVGISFGIERIYDVMEELNLFPQTISEGVKVLFVPREPELENFSFGLAQTLRNQGIGAEVYLGNVKKQKHFDYVQSKQIRYIVEVGSNEQQSGKFRLRDAQSRDTQSDMSLNELIERIVGL